MDKAKAQQVLARIDEILRWEQRMEQHKDQKFAELGKHLCEVRDEKYWRLGYESFEGYLEKKFPDGRRKAYYLMSIHDHLKQIPTPEIEDLGWAKALELAKVARHEGRGFNSAAWLDKAKQSGKAELKREVYKHLTGEDYEPYEMVYFKLYESQLPTVERALLVAARMVGSERSRGYCLELVCADFLAGRTEESTPEEILKLIQHLVKLLPAEYQTRLASQEWEEELERAARC
jgi:hypothetical protein